MADEPPKDTKQTPEETAEDGQKIAGTEISTKGGSMHVKVYAPFKTYFDDTALSISAMNDTGPFDILPRHHNFMTLITAGDVIVRHERGEEKIPIQRGVMHVKADEVVVFLDV